MMRISLILFLSLFVIFSLAEEAKQSEDVSVLNRIARSSGRDVKKDKKVKKRNTNRRQRNKAKKVKKEKKKNKDRKKRNKAKKVKKEKRTNKDRKKRNKAKNSRKSKSKSKKSKNRKNRPRNKKSKKEKKRSRKQRRKSMKNKENGKRNGSKNPSKMCARQSGPDDSTCMANIGTAMDYEGNQVANFLKQKKRIESFSNLMGKKGDKKGNFANSTSLITSACNSGSSDSTTTDTIATLNNCTASVEDGCTVPTVDTATLDSCVTSFTAVETKNAECYALLTAASPVLSDACTCYAAAAALVEETKLLSCSAKDEFDKVRTAKSSCLDSFSSCKKAEDATIGLIHICGGGTTPAPITTVTSAATTAGATTAGATTAAGATTTAGVTTTTTAAPTTAGATTTAGNSKCSKCGVVHVAHRVVGGQNTDVNEYPWMALMRLKSQSSSSFFCGGTLVNSKWVVTAAHCIVSQVSTSSLEIRLGEHRRSVTSDSIITKDFNVDYILKHPSYGSPQQHSNDIALVRLAEEADLSVYTPACLPASNEDFTGQMALLTGWGATSEGGSVADILQELSNLPIVSDTSCSSSIGSVPGYSGSVTSDMLCAGGEVGKDGCQGDSGGPLVVEDSSTSQDTLVGVVSWGIGCAREGLPGLYAEVSKFIPWMESTWTSNGGKGDTCEDN